MPTNKPELTGIKERLDEWLRSFQWWRRLNNCLRIISLVCSFTVAVGLRFFLNHLTIAQLLSWASFLSTVFMLWLQPARRARAYADSWRNLDVTYSQYLNDENFTADKVYDALREGEKAISATDTP